MCLKGVACYPFELLSCDAVGLTNSTDHGMTAAVAKSILRLMRNLFCAVVRMLKIVSTYVQLWSCWSVVWDSAFMVDLY